MQIRTATTADQIKIYQLIKQAFTTAQVSDGTEQDFANQLRQSDRYLPQLELVAEENGQLIGHVMFTEQPLQTVEGIKTMLLLAPLCVKLEYRSQGIGGQLIRTGFAKAKELGYRAVFLVGNPQYYGRFGFCQVGDYQIQNISDIPDEYVLGCELVPGGLSGCKGKIEIV